MVERINLKTVTIPSKSPPEKTYSRGMTALHEAARNGNTAEVKKLLTEGADIEAKDIFGFTPLFWAAIKTLGENHAQTVQLLLKSGASTEIKSERGRTPLHEAAESGNEEAAKLLLKHGAFVNARTKRSKRTPLHYAAYLGRGSAVAKLLLEHGAYPNAKDHQGYTPLHSAAMSMDYSEEMVKQLLERAEVNAADREGNTPLHSAMWRGPVDLANLLIDSGADATRKNKKGETPLELAKKRKWTFQEGHRKPNSS
ncbi:ankyrin repeat domain-containing protein [Candidatus Micrarchaeota archaeon]|nr:ankyrin repeat domain-containing protein [Candidatus Micrarchaeota archaeon]